MAVAIPVLAGACVLGAGALWLPDPGQQMQDQNAELVSRYTLQFLSFVLNISNHTLFQSYTLWCTSVCILACLQLQMVP